MAPPAPSAPDLALFHLAGCDGVQLRILADRDAVAAELPPGLAPRRELVPDHAALHLLILKCDQALVNDTLIQDVGWASASVFLEPQNKTAGAPTEHYLLEAFATNSSLVEDLARRGVPATWAQMSRQATAIASGASVLTDTLSNAAGATVQASYPRNARNSSQGDVVTSAVYFTGEEPLLRFEGVNWQYWFHDPVAGAARVRSAGDLATSRILGAPETAALAQSIASASFTLPFRS